MQQQCIGNIWADVRLCFQGDREHDWQFISKDCLAIYQLFAGTGRYRDLVFCLMVILLSVRQPDMMNCGEITGFYKVETLGLILI